MVNLVLGIVFDFLVWYGGIMILLEMLEIYGVEYFLIWCVVLVEVGEKLIEWVCWWEDYMVWNGGEMDNNLFLGNKCGGLIIILEKLFGVIVKGGFVLFIDVYKFGEQIDKKGFVFMDSFGFDLCLVMGQIVFGVNVVVFMIGCGLVFGYQLILCIKFVINLEMYVCMFEDMDINCGDVVFEGILFEDKGQ